MTKITCRRRGCPDEAETAIEPCLHKHTLIAGATCNQSRVHRKLSDEIAAPAASSGTRSPCCYSWLDQICLPLAGAQGMTSSMNSQLVGFLKRQHKRIETVFPPARVNRKIWRRLKNFYGKANPSFEAAPPAQVANETSVHDLRRRRNSLVQKLDAMGRDIEGALDRTGVTYRNLSGKDKVLMDMKYHGVRYYAMSKMLPTFRSGVAGSVLEIGCNSGLLSLIIKEEHPELECVAVDRCPKQIAVSNILKDFLQSDVNFKVVDGNKTATVVDSQKFDYIFLCELLEHLPYGEQQRQILRESIDLCKDDGRIIVTVPYEDRIPSPGHITEFHRDNLQMLLAPFAEELVWHETERHEFDLEKHFIVSFAKSENPTATPQ